MKMPWLMVASLLGALAVVMGAAGAHLPAEEASQRFFSTAFTYHMFHIFPLLAVSFLIADKGRTAIFAAIAGYLFLAGILLFSGSLYYLGITGQSIGFNITPFGGLSLISGWLALAVCGYLKGRSPGPA